MRAWEMRSQNGTQELMSWALTDHTEFAVPQTLVGA